MYMNHDEIIELCQGGAMENWDEACVNAASLDLRIGNTILIERGSEHAMRAVDYRKREKLDMIEVSLENTGFLIHPGMFFLAHTVERCNFPDNIAALFRIKSSMGRVGLEHCDAGWVDPGFNGSLTLEFFNVTQRHTLLLRPGDRIGQLVFFKGNTVSEDKSYRTKGNYNNQAGVAQIQYKE
jgi:dCTP deaminase